eukprot:327285_1
MKSVSYLYFIVVWYVFCEDNCSLNGTLCTDTQQNVLHRISTNEIGEIQEITLQSRQYKIKTLSIEPLAFEILNYLTDNECNEIIKAAKKVGLQSSTTHRNKPTQRYQIFDIDHDNYLNLSEMRITLEQNHDVNLNDNDIIEMYKILEVDKNNDNKLSKKELHAFNPVELANYIENMLLKSKPWKHSRMSKQSWLFYPDNYNEIITNIHHRLYDLFEIYSIPKYILEDSYPLQVVHYPKNGKYNAHYDSSFKKSKPLKCCFVQTNQEKNDNIPCKSCRFMTVLYYLNTVEKGGDTVFPLGNKYYLDKRFNQAAIKTDEQLMEDDTMEKYEPLKWRMSVDNLPEIYCKEENDNLKVKAIKGKALIWFNHLLDEKSQWIGDSDIYSMHTGCPIIKGEKWIANHWIQVDDKPKEFN